MRFRPCIDIHNGKVKQIVGGSLFDKDNYAKENFVSEQSAAYYADKYSKDGLEGGHIILLNKAGTDHYREDCKQALKALRVSPGKLQIGGGITDKNAEYFLTAGASHVIVTSYVFENGRIQYENLRQLYQVTGKERLVLDLSCRKKEDKYYIVTNRWQTFSDVVISRTTLEELAVYCDEFLVHAVDVEGKASGIETDLVRILADFCDTPITYAGGVSSFEDLELLDEISKGKLDVTIGSALDLFGGKIPYSQVVSRYR